MSASVLAFVFVGLRLMNQGSHKLWWRTQNNRLRFEALSRKNTDFKTLGKGAHYVGMLLQAASCRGARGPSALRPTAHWVVLSMSARRASGA